MKETITGKHYITGEGVALQLENGLIAEIELQKLQPDAEQHPIWIAPGLIDLQLNGYLGHDFNTMPLLEQTIHQITRELWKEGVTSYYPTVITNSSSAIEAAVRSIAAACRKDQATALGIAGIHLEGPFISLEDGPRGAHDRRYIQAPDWSLFERWQEAADGRIAIVTLSPEWTEAAEFIGKCAASGVTVSIGHTAATPEQIREAVAAGARMSTHLGNGAHLSLPRHPNYIWEQLAQDDLWTCVIADGFHLPDAFLKVAFRCKGPKAILVSDAVYLCGMPPGSYNTHIGGRVVLTPEGRLHLADHPQMLAGSAQMLLWDIDHLVRNGLCALPEAWDMASSHPAKLMRLPSQVGLSVGSPADLVQFRYDEQGISILRTYKNGVLVYDKLEHSEIRTTI